jgi:Flp pilus assembly protein TadG
MWLRFRVGRHRTRAQALVEFALVFPIFMLLIFSILILGLYVFYNQQLANAAGQAARYAAVHSSTALCPTVSRVESPTLTPLTYSRCDTPEAGWPNMTAAARSSVWGMNPSQVAVVGCWSGYVDSSNNYDALPVDPVTSNANAFVDCTMRDPSLAQPPVNPKANPGDLPCPATTIGSALTPPKADGDDKASGIAAAIGTTTNTSYPTTVTVYACFKWSPPLAGVIFIPSQVTLRAVVTEALQRQQ